MKALRQQTTWSFSSKPSLPIPDPQMVGRGSMRFQTLTPRQLGAPKHIDMSLSLLTIYPFWSFLMFQSFGTFFSTAPSSSVLLFRSPKFPIHVPRPERRLRLPSLQCREQDAFAGGESGDWDKEDVLEDVEILTQGHFGKGFLRSVVPVWITCPPSPFRTAPDMARPLGKHREPRCSDRGVGHPDLRRGLSHRSADQDQGPGVS